MSIEKLEDVFKEFKEDIFDEHKTEKGFDDITIIINFLLGQATMLLNILKDQADEMANLRQELAKKEDAIVINDKTKVGGTN